MRHFAIALFTALVAMATPCFAASPGAALPGLVLYSSLGYARPAARAFTKATGIAMRVVVAQSADVVAHVIEQGPHPRWSLAWFDDATPAVMLDQAGLLAHHLPLPPDLTKSGAQAVSSDHAWVPTGITLASILVAAANPYIIPPDHWAALTGPAYHGIIGMNDPELSRTTYAALAGLLQSNGGWPEGKSYINKLKRDGFHIYADDADTLAALRSGSIGMAVIKSSVAIDYAATRDRSLRLVFPKPVFAMPSVIVMANTLSQTQHSEALRFIAFINQPAIQKLRMRAGGSDGWYWPVTEHPAPHAGLPPLASLDVSILDASYWGQMEPAVMAWFNKDIVGPGN
jgi:iron(III) transport system substrate-binding protein